MTRNKTLSVPYFVQPTNVTCQSTVLKMFACYLERSVLLQSTGAGEKTILEIWKEINKDPKRPSKVLNAHVNMKWWLERYFSSFAIPVSKGRAGGSSARKNHLFH